MIIGIMSFILINMMKALIPFQYFIIFKDFFNVLM